MESKFNDGNDQKSTAGAHEVNARDCRNVSVTVYQDRAEVVRVISLPNLDFSGEHTIRLLSLTNETNPESIRVKGVPGCEILDVSHELQRKPSSDPDSASDAAIVKLKNQISFVKKEVAELSRSLSQVKREQALVQKYSDDALVKGKSGEQASLGLSEAREVIKFHSSEMARLDDREAALRDQLTDAEETEKNLRREMSKLAAAGSSDSHRFSATYCVTIVIDVEETAAAVGELELQFSYVVHNATWTPSYDLRINSESNELGLSYFAEVTQCTGEDWNDCRLFLSTSNPAIGSAPPPLPNSTVTFEFSNSYNSRNRKTKNSFKRENRMNYMGSDSDENSDIGGGLQRCDSMELIEDELNTLHMAPAASASPTSRIGVKGTGDAGSTMFVIPRDVTIASDSKPHKVTVMITTLTPQMVHYVAPSVSSHAYIQAKTQNTSQYPLLASKKVSVFLDGNFVASSSSIEQTSSGEYFSVYLGVDPSLKVTYTPCRTTRQTKGWLAGTEVKKMYFSTVVHNTKQRPCRVIVAEVLPRSSNDKISIELMEPSASSLTKSPEEAVMTSEQDVLGGLDNFAPRGSGDSSQPATAWPKDFVTQNKFTNNIVWLKTIPAGDKVELKFSYKIMWPQGQNISIDAR
mmetsp:Transcript_17152/g.28679  ORF Transcript_17152/g.28679 Transcript_17152/m.28679 type:complete len:634 (+) Transcript_17152:95-1996(+)|eukprot:CAMPEP_0114427740 /NCGR_PEP_ID=MMETSP0103-20121206/8528_1 /TAXON_ID=37642 ORGANISM="Paraphysomonas imperforata, Strain PA2" /NCGR_SAMPLE_ID=MMETSP0103 /ASSEMBLY_ACC=CAM_ASM_000201 /LENGTH=633 /DNA_ID=CAMNT_0001596859 /DNA_START=26 /DNA_END=1927 /DNA_ORIENTATION=-